MLSGRKEPGRRIERRNRHLHNIPVVSYHFTAPTRTEHTWHRRPETDRSALAGQSPAARKFSTGLSEPWDNPRLRSCTRDSAGLERQSAVEVHVGAPEFAAGLTWSACSEVFGHPRDNDRDGSVAFGPMPGTVGARSTRRRQGGRE